MKCLLVLLLAGCFEDRYRCDSDADCDRGPAARCELDGFCTQFDPTCATERRYDEHSAELANVCFEGQFALANPCAGGQPAALRDGCAATVCDVLPGCCDVGWSDACVQQAQLRCDLRCDTRIAVTATRNLVVEHWELAWNGSTWSGAQRVDRAGVLAWIGPVPGTIEPRLAGFDVGQTSLLVGEQSFPAEPLAVRTYLSISTVDFDRTGRDTIAVSFDQGDQLVQLIDVATGQIRDLQTLVGLRLAWGDSDRDAFPDGIAGRAGQYTLLRNVDSEFHVRAVEAVQSSSFGGGGTTGAPALRGLEWIDITNDGRLDLATFGNQVRIHADEGALSDTPLLALDCDPLATGCGMPRSQETSYAGAAVPTLGESTLVIAQFTDPMRMLPRALFRLTVDPLTPAFAVRQIPDACPTCPEIVAVIARDLDGDHVLDIIGLDAGLRLYTALSSGSDTLIEDPIVRGSLNGPFTNVTATVTGVPIP